MSKSKIGGRPQIIINKDILSHLTSIGFNSTDIAKIFNVGINLVVRCVKHDGLTDVLMELEDDNIILKVLREVNKFHKNVGYYHSSGHLRTK